MEAHHILVLLGIVGLIVLWVRFYLEECADTASINMLNRKYADTCAFEGQYVLRQNLNSLASFRNFNGNTAARRYIDSNWTLFETIQARNIQKNKDFDSYIKQAQMIREGCTGILAPLKKNLIDRKIHRKIDGYEIHVYYQYTSPAGRNHYSNVFVLSWPQILNYVEFKSPASHHKNYSFDRKADDKIWQEAREKYNIQLHTPIFNNEYSVELQRSAQSGFPINFHCYYACLTPDQVMSGNVKFDDFSGVYVFRNISLGKCYVGQAKSVPKRLRQHLSGRGNGDVYADWKYGSKFEIITYRIQDSPFASLDEMERYYIEAYNAYENGYNKTHGNN